MRISLGASLICVLAAVSSAVSAEPDDRAPDIVAVNVLLLLDAQTVERAREINRALRDTYPAGFAFDASHVPHISVLHAYVQSKDLAALYTAVREVTARRPLIGRQLAAAGLEYKPWNQEQLTSIKVEKTAELEAFQASILSALTPYRVAQGDQRAFVSSSEDSGVDQKTVEYVKTFAQRHAGSGFEPHITVGVSDTETAQKVSQHVAGPTKVTIASVAVYQLGNLGTARKELWRQAR